MTDGWTEDGLVVIPTGIARLDGEWAVKRRERKYDIIASVFGGRQLLRLEGRADGHRRIRS